MSDRKNPLSGLAIDLQAKADLERECLDWLVLNGPEGIAKVIRLISSPEHASELGERIGQEKDQPILFFLAALLASSLIGHIAKLQTFTMEEIDAWYANIIAEKMSPIVVPVDLENN